MSQILDDLEQHLRFRFAEASDEFITMAHAANVPQADIMITLGAVIIDAGVQFFANNTKLSAEDAGVMITRGVRTYRRSKEPAEFGPSGSP